MKAFLQQTEGEWFDDFVYISIRPLKKMDVRIIPFDETNIFEVLEKHKPNKLDILIGSVEATQIFFKYVGHNNVDYLGFPKELNDFYGRKIINMTYGEKPITFPYFIKPAKDIKLFTGSLIENKNQIEILENFMTTRPIKNNDEVYISDAINFISEYRCFINNKELVGLKHYQGDIEVFPDTDIIFKIISKYKNQPISYTIDIGVTDRYETYVVELNDFWALGSYGLDGELYVKLLNARFKEILLGILI